MMFFLKTDSVRIVAKILLGCMLCTAISGIAASALAQRVILNEDFENDTPDTLPNSADSYARSSINPDPNLDPSTAVVTGGAFADPFDPGINQSLLLYNPDGTTQQAVAWSDEFMDDASTFRNGSIDFDLWMDAPDPGAFWTFVSTRIGHGDAERISPSGTTADMTIWSTFRMQNLEGMEDPTEQITDPGNLISLGVETTYTDNAIDDLMGPGRSFHIRYEIEERGYSFSDIPIYRLIVDGTTIEWLQDGATEHFWVFQPGPALAPGINMLSFLTDASANASNPNPGTGNVYIDNLVIINDDLSPVDTDFDSDNDTDGADFLALQRGFGNGTTLAEGDADGSGGVDDFDLGFWQDGYGSASPVISSSLAVPEPNSLLIAMSLALIHLSARRPNSRRSE